MTRKDGPTSLHSVRSLLSASRARAETGHATSILLPASVALVNLLFCVLFENPIKSDPDGRSLSLFLFIQGWACFFLVLIHLASADAEILRKTLVMPITSSDRLTFAFLSPMRSPVLLALVLGDIFFLLVIFHRSVAAFIAIPLLVGLMATEVVMLASIACTAMIRRSRPPTIVAAYSLLGMFCIVAISLLLHMPTAYGILPPLSWTTKGIMAIGSGEFVLAFLSCGASAGLLCVTTILGRKLV